MKEVNFVPTFKQLADCMTKIGKKADWLRSVSKNRDLVLFSSSTSNLFLLHICFTNYTHTFVLQAILLKKRTSQSQVTVTRIESFLVI